MIDEIFNLTKFDEKQRAGEFCAGLLNGFDNDLPKNIHNIVNYVLSTPFFTPFPSHLIDFIRKTFEEFKYEQNEIKIEEATDKILNFIREKLNIVELSSKDEEFMKDPKSILHKVYDQHRVCSVHLESLDSKTRETIPIIIEYASKCVTSIALKGKLNDYLQLQTCFNYQSLDIIDRIFSENDLNDIMNKMPRCLQQLIIMVSSNTLEGVDKFSIVLQNLLQLTKLNLDFWYLFQLF